VAFRLGCRTAKIAATLDTFISLPQISWLWEVHRPDRDHLRESVRCRRDLKTFGDAGINFRVTPSQMRGVIRVRGIGDKRPGKLSG
jgi:hypothetical protein